MCLPGRRSPESLFPPKPDPKEGSKGDEGSAEWVTQAWAGSAGWSILSTCPGSGYPYMHPGAELSPRKP